MHRKTPLSHRSSRDRVSSRPPTVSTCTCPIRRLSVSSQGIAPESHPLSNGPKNSPNPSLLSICPLSSSKDLEIAYASGLRALCHKYKIIFIADEVRMGCGKTGRFLSSDYLTTDPHTQEALLKPDLLTLGKSITGGVYPATYVLGRSDCMDLVGTKEIMSTYGFSPMAVAATTAALQVIDEEQLVEKALFVERVFLEVTSAWKKSETFGGRCTWKFIKRVTAVGADMGVWLKDDLAGGQETVRAICAVCLKNGLLVFPNHRRVRMGVAMVITEDELRRGLCILKRALDEVLFD